MTRPMSEEERERAHEMAEFTVNMWRGVAPITPRSQEELLLACALLSLSASERGMREALEPFATDTKDTTR